MNVALALLLVSIAANPESTVGIAADTVVVCPDTFRPALEPWLEYRREQGHRIVVLSNLASAEELRHQIHETARGGRLRFVLLIGSADYGMYYDPLLRQRSVPMHYAKARVNVLWGSTPTISTDNWYAQADAATDELPMPSLAVGRIPAESPDELCGILAKIIAYERSTDFGPWRQRLNFVAGTGNFGSLADSLIESSAQYFLTNSIPAEYRVSMTQGNWQSPFCPDPRRLHQTAMDRLDEGSLFWVYIGHGYHRGLARMEVPGGAYPILEMPDAASLHGRRQRPIALFLSCFAGAIDAKERCLASALLQSPGGPVAIIAGTRVTMPYAMTLMATCMTDEYFHRRPDTLGEALLHAKQSMLKESNASDSRRAMLDSIAAAVSPAARQLAAERAEHVLMFNLIGDPLLRLKYPRTIAVQSPKQAAAGTTIEIEGTCPIEGQGSLELLLRRDLLRDPRPDRNVYPHNSETLSQFQDSYERANDHCLHAIALNLRSGQFHTTFEIPPSALGKCHLTLFVSGQNDFALGSVDVDIVKSSTEAPLLGAKERKQANSSSSLRK